MRKHTIFLTGGSGFIGRNILEQLGEKYAIIAPTHKQLDLGNVDSVEAFLKQNPVDVVVHTANVGGNRAEKNVSNVMSYNLRIFFNLVHNHRYFKKFIYLGSGAQYGKQSSLIRVREEALDTRIPTDEFGLYKYVCAKFIEETPLNMLNLSIFGIYGKHEEYAFRFISQSLCRVLFDLPIVIKQNVKFDYIYVDDFIRILQYFVEHDQQYRTYNIGTGIPIDLVTIAQRIVIITKKNIPILLEKKGLNLEYTCATDRLRKELSSVQYTDFDTALSRLYDWYKNKKTLLQRELFI
ncbi:MAG: NAD-dependent epimerase/dehydratase family protein [Patescibacteria group bacterium]